MDRREAQTEAAEYIKRIAVEAGASLVLMEDATLGARFGWVFFYRSADGELLAGNAPFIIDRRNGSLHVTGTARPVEESIGEFARHRRVLGS
jgi:hypothetical protein